MVVVFQIYHKLLAFFDNIEKENKLLTAVYRDLSILQF